MSTLKLYRKFYLLRRVRDTLLERYQQATVPDQIPVPFGLDEVSAALGLLLSKRDVVLGCDPCRGMSLAQHEDIEDYLVSFGDRIAGLKPINPETACATALNLPGAVGTAFSDRFQKRNRWIMVFVDSSSVQTSLFKESVEFAARHQLRMLFVCEHDPSVSNRNTRERADELMQELRSSACLTAATSSQTITDIYHAALQLKQAADEQCQPGMLILQASPHIERVGVAPQARVVYREQQDSSGQAGRGSSMSQRRVAVAELGEHAVSSLEKTIDRDIAAALADMDRPMSIPEHEQHLRAAAS